MRNSYMPAKKPDQVAWAARFVSVVGDGTTYGVAKDLMTSFTNLNATLQTAWATAQDERTRTKVTVDQANVALANMKAAAKGLVSIIQGTPTVTSDMKIAAGLTVRKTKPTKKSGPTTAPKLSVTRQVGRTLTIELANADGTKRAKPTNALNALVFVSTGTLPQEDNGWTFYCTTTSRTVDVVFPPSTTGDTVFVTAMWASATSETGPAASPLSVDLPAGGFLPQAEAKNRPTNVRKAA